MLRQWKDAGIDIGVTLTESARQFLTPLLFEALGASPVFDAMYADKDTTGHFDDIFPHLQPGASAHAFAIVAASATTLARLAHGMGDEILSCQALAFPHPLVLAPAMNPRMWANPATQENWETLRRRGHILVEPAHGRVACLEEGGGRLADSREIYLAVLKALSVQDFAGQKIMITMGPTREFWDGIRYWSNPSTGTMGAAVAVAAYLRGAEVHAVTTVEQVGALLAERADRTWWSSGGGQVYRLLWPYTTHLDITEVHAAPEADVTFPAIEADEWREMSRTSRPEFDFVTFERTSPAAQDRLRALLGHAV